MEACASLRDREGMHLKAQLNIMAQQNNLLTALR